MKTTFKQAITAHKEGKLLEAEHLYRVVLETQPVHSDANHNLGSILVQKNKFREALPLLKIATESNPTIELFLITYSNALVVDEQFEEAETSYKKLVKLNPNLFQVYFNWGNMQQNLGRIKEAEVNFKKAIKIKPDFSLAYNSLGAIQKDLGDLVGAEANFNKAIKIKPDYVEAYTNLGATKKELGDLEAAEISLIKAIELKPDYVNAYVILGMIKSQLGKFKDAEKYYLKVIDLKPDYSEVHYHLAMLLYESERYKEAEEHYKLVDTKESENNLLRCLYHQNKKNDFYDQLDLMINLNKCNAVMGSLIYRSELRYGIKKKNVFCENPIKYVSKINLTEQCDFKSIFIDTTKSLLKNDSVTFRSQGLLTHGQQTAGNLFNLKNDLIIKIYDLINLQIQKYRNHFKDSKEGFLRNWPDDYSLYGWLISLKNGGSLRSHMHDLSWISGSIYINVPPKLQTDSGNLVLNKDYPSSHPNYDSPDKNVSSSLSKINEEQVKIVDVVTGSLCLFPSSLLHHTIPFESTEDRIVLAFDVRAK